MTSGEPSQEVLLQFPGREEEVRRTLMHLRAWMKALRLRAATRGDVELVLAEVLNNVVEHALPGHLNNLITVRGQIEDTSLAFSVMDHGTPMPDETLPDGLQPELGVALNDLPEGGFGWMMVRELTSDVHYFRQLGMNCTSLYFTLGQER